MSEKTAKTSGMWARFLEGALVTKLEKPGNILLLGAPQSGKKTLLRTLEEQLHQPSLPGSESLSSSEHVYLLDFRYLTSLRGREEDGEELGKLNFHIANRPCEFLSEFLSPQILFNFLLVINLDLSRPDQLEAQFRELHDFGHRTLAQLFGNCEPEMQAMLRANIDEIAVRIANLGERHTVLAAQDQPRSSQALRAFWRKSTAFSGSIKEEPYNASGLNQAPITKLIESAVEIPTESNKISKPAKTNSSEITEQQRPEITEKPSVDISQPLETVHSETIAVIEVSSGEREASIALAQITDEQNFRAQFESTEKEASEALNNSRNDQAIQELLKSENQDSLDTESFKSLEQKPQLPSEAPNNDTSKRFSISKGEQNLQIIPTSFEDNDKPKKIDILVIKAEKLETNLIIEKTTSVSQKINMIIENANIVEKINVAKEENEFMVQKADIAVDEAKNKLANDEKKQLPYMEGEKIDENLSGMNIKKKNIQSTAEIKSSQILQTEPQIFSPKFGREKTSTEIFSHTEPLQRILSAETVPQTLSNEESEKNGQIPKFPLLILANKSLSIESFEEEALVEHVIFTLRHLAVSEKASLLLVDGPAKTNLELLLDFFNEILLNRGGIPLPPSFFPTTMFYAAGSDSKEQLATDFPGHKPYRFKETAIIDRSTRRPVVEVKSVQELFFDINQQKFEYFKEEVPATPAARVSQVFNGKPDVSRPKKPLSITERMRALIDKKAGN